jgi:hypothetical protein
MCFGKAGRTPMAMKALAERDEAFYVVNKTIAEMRKRLNRALDKPIQNGAFNSVMTKVMRDLYPPKKKNAGKRRR